MVILTLTDAEARAVEWALARAVEVTPRRIRRHSNAWRRVLEKLSRK